MLDKKNLIKNLFRFKFVKNKFKIKEIEFSLILNLN